MLCKVGDWSEPILRRRVKGSTTWRGPFWPIFAHCLGSFRRLHRIATEVPLFFCVCECPHSNSNFENSIAIEPFLPDRAPLHRS